MKVKKLYCCMCSVCGILFESEKRNRKSCSTRCSSALGIIEIKENAKLRRTILICQTCNKEFEISFSEKNKKYCSWNCKITNEKMKQNFREKMLVKNPMKDPEVSSRMSKTRRENVTSDPVYCDSLRKSIREAWASGKYDGVAVGRCKWYQHTKPDGSIVSLQGTWEVAYARWMDSNGIEYESHVGRIPYVDNSGIEHFYYPDFRLILNGEYIDVKNPLYEKIHAEKLDCVRRSNPKMSLRVVNLDEMKSLGLINYNTSFVL